MTWLLLIIPALIIAGRVWAATSPSVAKGVSEDNLAGCPASPNCVSTESQDAKSMMERLTLTRETGEVLSQIAELTQREFGAKIATSTPNYLHVVVSSRVFGFRDDLEFLLPPDADELQIRSASRTGYSDFGKNRKRIEILENTLQNAGLVHQKM